MDSMQHVITTSDIIRVQLANYEPDKLVAVILRSTSVRVQAGVSLTS